LDHSGTPTDLTLLALNAKKFSLEFLQSKAILEQRTPKLTRDEAIAKIAPDNGLPVHAKADAGLVGLFVNP
jgi:hypothetical protein